MLTNDNSHNIMSTVRRLNMDLKRIGEAMKLLRNSKNWSLEKESQMLNIHRNTLAIYEENPENMSMGLFNEFLLIHNVSREYCI